MSPIHFRILEAGVPAFGLQPGDPARSVDRQRGERGLTFVNNDACYPSILVVGQMMAALRSGRYDLSRTALLISQTGGGCRATNYIAFIRKALADAGLAHVPVISLNAARPGEEPRLPPSLGLLARGLMALVYGDLLMRMLYRVRPYETVPGAADRLCERWTERCARRSRARGCGRSHRTIRAMVRTSTRFPFRDGGSRESAWSERSSSSSTQRPTTRSSSLIESEGAEAVVPDLIDFLLYASSREPFRRRKARPAAARGVLLARLAIALIEMFRVRAETGACRIEAVRRSPAHPGSSGAGCDGIVQLGNITGEGWFLTAEMVELIHSGVQAIACIQPFACLPNHVTGKGMIRELRRRFPAVTIAAIDYDPGASEVNQLNRLKLMLAGPHL